MFLLSVNETVVCESLYSPCEAVRTCCVPVFLMCQSVCTVGPLVVPMSRGQSVLMFTLCSYQWAVSLDVCCLAVNNRENGASRACVSRYSPGLRDVSGDVSCVHRAIAV